MQQLPPTVSLEFTPCIYNSLQNEIFLCNNVFTCLNVDKAKKWFFFLMFCTQTAGFINGSKNCHMLKLTCLWWWCQFGDVNPLESVNVGLLSKELLVQALLQCWPLGGAVVLVKKETREEEEKKGFQPHQWQMSRGPECWVCWCLLWQLGNISGCHTVLPFVARPPCSNKTLKSRRTRCCWSWWEPEETNEKVKRWLICSRLVQLCVLFLCNCSFF